MRGTALGITVFFVLACGGLATPEPAVTPEPAAAPEPAGPMAVTAARFATFDCSAGSTDSDRSWCPVAAAGHGPFTAPLTTEIRLGLTLGVAPGQSPRDAVLEHTTLSALFIGPDGAKLLDIQPSNEDEMADLLGVVMSIAATLKGVPDSSVLVKVDLQEYLSSKTGDLHPLAMDADGATFQGMTLPATIQRIEGSPWRAAYVVVEEAPDGTLVSVFPDSDLTVLPQ